MSNTPDEKPPGSGSRTDSTGEFFSVGTPLHAVRAGYIRRRADDLLFEAAVAGRFAHVIAPGRSGKSSLIAATAARLENNDIRVAILDLSQIGVRDGTPDAGRWYYNVAYRLLRQLRVRFDLQTWWQDKSMLSNRQRLVEFYSEVLLDNVDEQITIFIDEMQIVGELPFADQLLASVRSAHNARVTDPDFNRLTFILLGECDPLVLIDEAEMSPFNVTQPVPLDDFSRPALDLFATELNLEPDDAKEALDRIYYWTRGQPYLTQKLARAVARISAADDIAAQVDRIVAQQLTGRAALHSEPHMSHIHRQIMNAGKLREGMLNLYGKIRKGIAVPADLGSPLQRRLLATGLLEVDEAGELRIRNRVYEAVFTARWANENMRTQWRVPLLLVAALAVVLLLPLWYTQWLPRPYAALLAAPTTEIADAESAWRNLRSFPGHAQTADNLYRAYLSDAAARTDNAGLVMSIASLARELPDAGTLPEQMQAEFWDRRVLHAVRQEQRDAALLASLEALEYSTSVRRNRAANLVADDYPLLLASLRPDAPGRLLFDSANLLLSAVNGAELQQWSFERDALVQRSPWSITALEVAPLVRRVIVDQEGTTRRIGLTLNISHPRLRDLRLKLIAPSGRIAEIQLGLERASSTEDIQVPAGQLRELVGESLTGTWSLSVRDEAIGVAGHLAGWTLNLNSQGLEEGFQRGISIPDPVERKTEQFWVSDDGRYAVARAEHSDSARVWDLAYARPLGTVSLSAQEKLVGLTTNAQQLISATLESVNVWDTGTGVRVASLPVGIGSAGVQLTRDRQHLFAQVRGDSESRFELWQLASGEKLAEFVIAGVPGLIALDASGMRIAAADYDRTVRTWDFRSGELLAQMDFPLQPTAIQLDAAGQTLAAIFGTSGLSVRRIDAPQQPLLEEFAKGQWQFAFSPSGARMVAGRPSTGYQVYSSVDGQRRGPALGLTNVGNTLGGEPILQFSRNEDVLLTGNVQDVLRLWHIPDMASTPVPDDRHVIWSPSGDAIVAAFPDASGLAIADRAGHVHLYAPAGEASQVLTASEDVSFLGHNREVRHLAVSEDGKWLASVAADNTLRVWDGGDGQPLPFIASLPAGAISQLVFSPDATLIALLADNRAVILRAANGEILADLDLGGAHSGIAFASNDTLYVGGESGALSMIASNALGGWDLRHVWKGDVAIRRLAASPRGRFLVLADENNSLLQFSLADAAPGDLRLQLPGRINDIRFSASGARMLVLGDRWVHRLSSSAHGLLWLDALLVPRALNGAGIVIKEGTGTSNRAGDEFYLPVARDSAPRMERFRFSDPVGPGLIGLQDALLADWRGRLGE